MVNFLFVLFLGWSGAHKFAQGKVGMGLLYLFTGGLFGIGWLYDIIIALTNISKPNTQKKTFNNQKITSELPTSFSISGMSYRKDDIKSIMKTNSPKYSDYVYRRKEDFVQLVPEPQNPHDHNAIKVMMNGVHIGYVPAELTRDIKPLISNHDFVATIRGGDKFVGDGIQEYDFKAYVEVV